MFLSRCNLANNGDRLDEKKIRSCANEHECNTFAPEDTNVRAEKENSKEPRISEEIFFERSSEVRSRSDRSFPSDRSSPTLSHLT